MFVCIHHVHINCNYKNYFMFKILIEGALKTAFTTFIIYYNNNRKYFVRPWNSIKIMILSGCRKRVPRRALTAWWGVPAPCSRCLAGRLSRQLPSQQLFPCTSGKALFHIQTAGTAQVYSTSASANLFTFRSGFKDIYNST